MANEADERAEDHVREECRPSRRGATDEFAEELRAACRAVMAERGLSQKQWCELASIKNPSALGNFLNGLSRTLNFATLVQLAHAVDMTVSQLTREDPRPLGQPSKAVALKGGNGKRAMRVTLESADKDDFRFTAIVEIDMPRGINRLISELLKGGASDR
jgi:transcriptional regulator with XRE-family HTH domain